MNTLQNVIIDRIDIIYLIFSMDLSWKYQMNPIEGTLKLEVLKGKEAKELDIYLEHINVITLTFPLPFRTSSICIAFCRSRVALAAAAAMTASTSAVMTWHFFNEESRKDGVTQNREQSEQRGRKFSTSQLMSVYPIDFQLKTEAPDAFFIPCVSPCFPEFNPLNSPYFLGEEIT